jgi:hypothetical protein
MSNNHFCFCGLAIGKKYRDFAINAAKDLQKYHPNIQYIILTDKAKDFEHVNNITAIQHSQDSIMFPYHDRRLVIERALEIYDITIQIDTDIRLKKALLLPPEILGLQGITGTINNLKNHIEKYQPENLYYYQKVAEKLDIDFDNSPYVGEFVFAVSRYQGLEKEFIQEWGRIGRYLELHKIHGADGPAIGLAIMKVGLPFIATDWSSLIEHEYTEHLKFSSGKTPLQKSKLEQLKFRIGYHYRLNKAKLNALKDFKFFYE